MKYFIPINLDIDSIIDNVPPKIDKFKKEHLLYVINLVTAIPANNKLLTDKDGYVPINAKLLQKAIRNYKSYINYLLQVGILETDNRYVPGTKSKGYRFAATYGTIIRLYSDVEIAAKKQIAGSLLELNLNIGDEYAHLVKWFNSELQIDKEAALLFILNDYRHKASRYKNVYWDSNSGTYKNLTYQYNRAVHAIEKISDGPPYYLTIDDRGFRLHSPLTNLRSDIRNFLTYSGLKLVSIDVTNSQPYLCTLLFNPSFWELTPSLHTITLNNLGLDYTSVFKSYSKYSSFIMLCKKYQSHKESDVHTFKRIVEEGRFYEYMAERLNIDEHADRKSLKSSVFQVLFTDNRYIGQEEALPKRIFKQVFPDVYKLISLLKRKNKVCLPILLQRIESFAILKSITKRISNERPTLPFFTIHDSIITTQGSEQYVNQIMNDEMARMFGFAPKLLISNWHPTSLLQKAA